MFVCFFGHSLLSLLLLSLSVCMSCSLSLCLSLSRSKGDPNDDLMPSIFCIPFNRLRLSCRDHPTNTPPLLPHPRHPFLSIPSFIFRHQPVNDPSSTPQAESSLKQSSSWQPIETTMETIALAVLYRFYA